MSLARVSAKNGGPLSAHPLKWLKSKEKSVADGRADRVLVALPLRIAKTKALLGGTEKHKDEWDCFRIARRFVAIQGCFPGVFGVVSPSGSGGHGIWRVWELRSLFIIHRFPPLYSECLGLSRL